ncbi:hypothetical protein VTK73DRAFT_5816 [Phialemonium thermophilum]|uniref:BHLH domain-containing protein n=1 Tax=Phialemonium thermophilum TaxID=223376 RepID=A0ABR3WLM1_9PEZI
MDSNQLRHLEFFSIPNNQTVNPVSQTFDSSGSQTNRSSSTSWGTNALPPDAGATGPASTAPSSLSLESFDQPSVSTAPTSLSMQPPSARSSVSGSSKPTPHARQHRRDSHPRKRSKLSTESSPLDSVDYWIKFDNEEPLSTIPESGESSTGKIASTQRSFNTKQSVTSRSAQPAVGSAFNIPDFMDDSALDNALSDEEESFSSINLADQLSRLDSVPPSEIPPREGLYSTPLSWERPQPGLRMDSLIGLNSSVLNEAEQRRLIAIAMNPGPSMGGLGSNLNLDFGGLSSEFDSGPSSTNATTSLSQITNQPPQPKPLPQRTTSTASSKQQSNAGDKHKEKAKPADRTAHNDIERKYRTNLKDKIAELRNAVPSLQTMSEGAGEGGESSQQGRAPKVSKGTVLTKATEYIHYLERRNRQIVQEHQELSRRLQAFEQLLNATTRPTFQMPNYSHALFDPRAFC